MIKIGLFLVLFILLVGSVNASTIRGKIYGPDFNLVKDVLVKVSTDSGVLSSMVSKDGSYSFDVKDGTYVIEAEIFDNGIRILEGKENIEVGKGGVEIDLVVLPFVDNGPNEFNVDTNIGNKTGSSNFIITILIIFLAGVFILFYLYKKGLLKLPKKKNKEDLPNDLEDLIKLIEKRGRRINQVDLRKDLPYSEAKVSLMISDLEERGIIKRIKKGRGNILILK